MERNTHLLEREKRIQQDTLDQFDAQTRIVARMQSLALWAGWWAEAEELKAHRLGLRMTRCLYGHDAFLCLDVLETSSREVGRQLAIFERRMGARNG